jgi:NAD(P)-dependent dehydrogenase (short-subunit alcohol dehydrogenase family)
MKNADGIAVVTGGTVGLGRAIGIPTDMADHRQVDAASQAINEQFGPIATWVNNAMTGIFAEFTSTHPADFERAVAVNFWAPPTAPVRWDGRPQMADYSGRRRSSRVGSSGRSSWARKPMGPTFVACESPAVAWR